MNLSPKILKIVLTLLLVFALIASGVLLFGGNLGEQLMGIFKSQNVALTKEELKIGFAAFPHNFNPTSLDFALRNVTADIYESLVKFDREFKIVPSLAVSWGMLDENTWEFRLRKEVFFHNGNALRVEDVVGSLEYARLDEDSQMKNLLNNVVSVRNLGEKIQIKTFQPDPLLLNKLALVSVFPAGYGSFDAPMGTGAYRFDNKFGNTISLIRNENYWGEKPVYKNIVLKAFLNQDDRFDAFQTGEVDLIVDLPANAACSLSVKFKDSPKCVFRLRNDVKVESVPSLDVGFLIFQQDSQFFNKVIYRKAFADIFDGQFFVDNSFGFARTVGQFVSSGVFGFNPDIVVENKSFDAAKKTITEAFGSGFEQSVLVFDYPENLDMIGQYVQAKFSELGIQVVLQPLNAKDLQADLSSGAADLYFVDWKSDLGDASDFFENFVHTKDVDKNIGQLNGFGYSNLDIDNLIDSSRSNLKTADRLKSLQQAMRILVVEDVWGVPIFETDKIFGYNLKIDFKPRLDGIIHPSEII